MRRILAAIALAACCLGSAQAAQQVETQTLRLTFGENGRLESAIACFPSCSDANTRLQQFADQATVSWNGFTAGEWTHTVDRSGQEWRIRYTHSSGAAAHWTVPARGYLIELELDVPGELAFRSGESFRPREAAGFSAWLEQSRYVVMGDGDVTQVGFDEESEVSASDSQWIGYRNRYWSMLAAPPALSDARLLSGEGRQDAELRIAAKPGRWSFYIGPVEPAVLGQAAPGLDGILYAGLWFWLRWVALGLFFLLGWIQAVVPSWGLAIMVMSLLVAILMIPLNRIAERYQQEVNEIESRIAPELGRIKQNYKGAEQSEKILALYKAEEVHPLYSLKSMLGVLLLVPVFIGAFNMLAENIHLLNVPFLWIGDLSGPDSLFTLPFRLPFFGADFNLLPFLMTGLSILATALHNPPALDAAMKRKQVVNLVLMAVLFFAIFYTFPAGMVLYWATTNLVSATKSLWTRMR